MINPTSLNSGVFPNWCPGCVMPGTLIHANPSVKAIETLKEGEKVLGSDGRYHKITEMVVHRHKGKMFRIKTKYFGETVVTDDHPVYVGKRRRLKAENATIELSWERADKIQVGDYIPYPIPKDVVETCSLKLPGRLFQDRKSKELPEKIPVNESFARLAGYYLSEGYIKKRGAIKNFIDSEIIFTFNSAEKALAQDVTDIARQLFGTKASTKIRQQKHTIDVSIYSARLARAFHEWFESGAKEKTVPHFMMLLPPALQKELLKGLWRGDGWVHQKRMRASYKTISPRLAEQVKILLLRQGIVPTMLREPAREGHQEAWSVWVLGKRDFPTLGKIIGEEREMPAGKGASSIIDRDYAFLPVSGVSSFDYDGPVYNMEVQEVHSYVSRNAILHNCGDFAIFASVKNSLVKLDMPIEKHFFVFGIGCHGHMVNFMKAYGFEGLHGRPLPVAEGARLANRDLNVVVVSGDGDTYGEGMSHFMHIMRRNFDITLIVHNNMVYGLTIGQASPTADCGFRSRSTPEGLIEHPVNPIALAIAGGATFVARGFAGDPAHLTNLIMEAINHRGFSLIDVFQPCVTFNSVNTYQWFRERIYKLEEKGHNPSDKIEAMKRALEPDKLPIGVFYREQAKQYEEQTPTQKSIVKEPIEADIGELLQSMR